MLDPGCFFLGGKLLEFGHLFLFLLQFLFDEHGLLLEKHFTAFLTLGLLLLVSLALSLVDHFLKTLASFIGPSWQLAFEDLQLDLLGFKSARLVTQRLCVLDFLNKTVSWTGSRAGEGHLRFGNRKYSSLAAR